MSTFRRFNSVDAVDILVSRNADLSIQCSTTGNTAFLVATRMGNTGVVKRLLEKNPKVVEDRDYQDLTALHWASLRGSYDICKLLVTHGASISKRTNDGSTAVVYAAESKNVEILSMLLDQGRNNYFR